MVEKILEHRALTTLGVGLLALGHLLWEHTHGGVVSHNIMAREDLPAISNWWGLLSLPLLTFIVISLIRNRRDEPSGKPGQGIAIGFVGGLVLGVLLAVFWEWRLEAYMHYLLLVPLVLALFLPVYRPECLLGFVLGMTWTFGEVLPIGIGLILLILSWIIHKGIRGGVLRLLGKRA